MRKILITGGAGFIGSALAHTLAAAPENKVIVIDNLATGFRRHLNSNPAITFIKCDVNNYEDISSVMERYGFDYVFHYAAVVGVNRTIEHPKTVLDDIRGLQHIFMLSKNTGVKRIFFASSSEVYGEPVHIPEHEENTPLNSKQPYAVVKNIGECFCRVYCSEFGLNYTIFRFFNTYGPNQSTDFVINKFIDAALQNRPINIYGNGSQTRTFCFIEDNMRFTKEVFDNDLFINEVVNVGNDKQTDIRGLAELIIELTGSSSKIQFLPPLPEGDMSRRQPDITKMRSVLKTGLTDLRSGIKKILATMSLEKQPVKLNGTATAVSV